MRLLWAVALCAIPQSASAQDATTDEPVWVAVDAPKDFFKLYGFINSLF